MILLFAMNVYSICEPDAKLEKKIWIELQKDTSFIVVRPECAYVHCQSLINLLYLYCKYNTLYVIVKSNLAEFRLSKLSPIIVEKL